MQYGLFFGLLGFNYWSSSGFFNAIGLVVFLGAELYIFRILGAKGYSLDFWCKMVFYGHFGGQ